MVCLKYSEPVNIIIAISPVPNSAVTLCKWSYERKIRLILCPNLIFFNNKDTSFSFLDAKLDDSLLKNNNSINFNALKWSLSVFITLQRPLSYHPNQRWFQTWTRHESDIVVLCVALQIICSHRRKKIGMVKTIQSWPHSFLNWKLLVMVGIWLSTWRVARVHNKLDLQSNFFIGCDITPIAA